MRVGYGYNRAEKAFAHADIDVGPGDVLRIFLDSKATDRSEREEMFLLLKPGDTVVLLFKGDLARGAHSYEAVWSRIKQLGVRVEICPPDKPTEATRPRGRPAIFDPTPDDDEEIKTHWHDVDGRPGRYAVKVAKRLGYDVKEHQLRHRYGRRGEA